MIAGVAPEIGAVRSLLDVGTGVGLLAVAATNLWPDATVVGIDTWEPSLSRARDNVTNAGLTDRIQLRRQDIADLDDVERYDLAWVPTFFLTEPTIEAAVPALFRAVAPGGWIVLGRMLAPPDPAAKAMMELRTYRSGGVLLDEEHSIELLEKAGFTAIRVAPVPPPAPMSFTIGQKPT
jgi:cyclopropane fatty-acyl-phospholipid synthase-like methyltransferase